MKSTLTKLVAGTVAVCALALVPPAARAADGNIDLAVNSAYVWRGQMYNDEAVFQPSVTVSTDYGLSFNTWGNWNLTDNQGTELRNEFCEIDLTLSYAKTLGMVECELGVAEYLYPHTVTEEDVAEGQPPSVHATPGTREAYLSAAFDVVLSPTIKVSYDFDEVNAFFAEASVSHSMELTEDLSAELMLSIGGGDKDYNTVYWGVDEAAVNDGNAKLSFAYNLSESLTLGAYVQYTKLLDSKIEDAADASESLVNDGDIVFGGGSLSYSF